MRLQTAITLLVLAGVVTLVASSVWGLVLDWRALDHNPERNRGRCGR